jgi:hypothetical protein
MEPLIKLQEQQTLPIPLFDNEAEELASLRMDVRPRSDALFEVNPGSLVGHFHVGDKGGRTVYIEPKVGIRNVLTLLGGAYQPLL